MHEPRPLLRALPAVLTCLVALTVLVLGPLAPAASAPGGGVSVVGAVLDPDEVWAHLEALSAIAEANGGTRAAGTPGYAASVDYVAAHVAAAGYTVTREAFDVDVSVAVRPATLEIDASPTSLTFTGDADLLPSVPDRPGEIADAPVVDVGDGCDGPTWSSVPEGSVAFISEAVPCDIWLVNVVARDLGVSGLLVGATCASCDAVAVEYQGEAYVPTLSLSSVATDALASELEGGPVTVSFDTGHELERVTTWNVLAERPGLDPDAGVIVLGSHLDSMPAGPGINDPASGVAALLELADRLAATDTGPAVRFGFWGAEELGLLGSTHHVEGLAPAELAEIRAYLNLDMIASPNWATFVYDPVVAADPATASAGSADIADRFYDWFAAQGRPTLPIWTDGRSDDGPFALAGVPVGGVFSGAEEIKSEEVAHLFGGTAGIAFDPCYHLSCDTLVNVARDALTLHSEALAAVALDLLVAPPGPRPAGEPGTAVAPTFTG